MSQVNDSFPKAKADLRNDPLYDSGTVKVTLFAGALIIFSMLLIGTVVYLFTKEEAVNKLKTKDLLYIAQSMATRVDGRIERAQETSMVLASDPELVKWVAEGETNQQLGEYALEKIDSLVKEFGYTNSFIVSAVTNHYWAEGKRLLDTVSRSDPDDEWFFQTLSSKERLTLQLDSNAERGDTFVFVDVIMHDDQGKPIAVVGVGMSLRDLAVSFAESKYSAQSNLWLIDKDGVIHMSDRVEHIGMKLDQVIPHEAAAPVFEEKDEENLVIDYMNESQERYDLISYPLRSTDWRLVYSIPRDETVGFLRTILLNTAIAVLVALFSIIFFFFFVSRKLANPYRRALHLNLELEKQIAARTKELAQHNEKIMDSIDYAKRIQESILPEKSVLAGSFADYFVLWRPRDIVGGDFYWFKPCEEGYLVAVGDCTGHGVPGAFMTMLTITALNRISEDTSPKQPAELLSKLNRQIKETLRQDTKEGLTDDGLDIGLLYVTGRKAVYAGAGCSLYVAAAGGMKSIKGDRRSVGYRKTMFDYPFTNHELSVDTADCLYLSTDGYFDQNGGDKNYSFGRRRFVELIERICMLPLHEQKQRLEHELQVYMKQEPQRDDITVLGIKPR
jgi:serine phosphatase RsbU (regulator of sigma subunit)